MNNNSKEKNKPVKIEDEALKKVTGAQSFIDDYIGNALVGCVNKPANNSIFPNNPFITDETK